MSGHAKELRLGLVCYGGSSLCIYMHGITKEIHRLVHASAVRSAGGDLTEPTEKVYGDLLASLAEKNGVDLRIIVDVIAGTSAGGINGIFLGKAIAGNRSQDGLRDLWFNRGDMDVLTIGPKKFAGFRLTWKRKLPWLIKHALTRSPLRGNEMANWLHDALKGMDSVDSQASGGTSLMPEGHPLDLWVTITDFYGYQRWIPLSHPKFVPDSRHRHVLNFHYESVPADAPENNDFSDNAALTFAARTTSCFPGVFPPVNPAELSAAIGAPLGGMLERSFRSYYLSGANPNSTFFVDGGVLDNKPFGWAIDTIIRNRPAESEIDRKLLYIEPDPGGHDPTQGGPSPETLPAAIGAAMKIPRSEPILDDLMSVEEHNERVGRIRDVIEANFERVGTQVDALLQGDVLSSPPATWPWTSWNDQVHGLAMAEAGAAYATYVRMKISSVLDGFASSACALCNYPPESDHALLVREAIHGWGRSEGLYAGVGRVGAGGSNSAPFTPSLAQVEFLQAFDLGFMRRRLRFMIAALNWWYDAVGQEGFPSRTDLDHGKTALYGEIAALDALAGLRISSEQPDEVRQQADTLRALVLATFQESILTDLLNERGPDGTHFAANHNVEITNLYEEAKPFFAAQLARVAPATLDAFVEIASSWARARRRDLVVRFLGFPLWDVLIYPVQALSQVGEGDAIDVVRISPREASGLLEIPEGGKVEGIGFHHFYAFFHREARENDYLWGRLDAAQQVVRLLLASAGGAEAAESAQDVSTDALRPWCRLLFGAILDEEGDSLATLTQKTERLRREIAAL
jgi:patatin-related protein